MSTHFDLKVIRECLDKEVWEENDIDDCVENRGIFIGTVFDLLPSGKYYTPWANSNVNLEEASKDETWFSEVEEELDTIGCCLESGEGDPCDLFVAEYRSKNRKVLSPNSLRPNFHVEESKEEYD